MKIEKKKSEMEKHIECDNNRLSTREKKPIDKRLRNESKQNDNRLQAFVESEREAKIIKEEKEKEGEEEEKECIFRSSELTKKVKISC